MIQLNLLPPSEKKILGLERTFRWLVFYGNAIIFLILLFIVFLTLIWFFVLIQLKSYSANLESTKTSFQGQSIENQQKLIKEFNEKLDKIDGLQQKQKRYYPILAELAMLVPGGVRIEALSIDESGQGRISGFANQRGQLLLFKSALEKSSYFEKIENPLSNLTKQININFYFTFNAKTAK